VRNTVISSIIECLRHLGVPFLSAYPTTPLIDAAASADLRPIICRQERVGVGIADGYTRVTNGRPPGVFAMQWGPGSENAYPGVATAFSDHVPMLLLPMGHPTNRAGAKGYFDSKESFRTVTKAVYRIDDSSQTYDIMRRALSSLLNGPPGPVMVEIPADVGLAEVDPNIRVPRPVVALSAAHAGDVASAITKIQSAQRPIIVAGQGVLYGAATEPLRRLAEYLAVPVATTLAGKSAFPEHHPLSLGTGGSSMPGPVSEFYRNADVVLALGTSLTRHFLTAALPKEAHLIHVTGNVADLSNDYDPEIGLVGDIGIVIDQLFEAAQNVQQPADSSRIETAIGESRRRWLNAWVPLLSSDEVPINPYRVVGELCSAFESIDSIVTHDSGSPRDQMIPFYRARAPRSYISWGRSHGLGTGLGLIMGAKMARPEAACVNVMGDAAFGMVGLDFETAVREQIPIITVVFNNSIMACEAGQMRVAHERFQSRRIGGKYAELARAMGGYGITVDRPQGIGSAFQEAITHAETGIPVLVEMITSPDEAPVSLRRSTEG
jgi:acetolactate synthase-1/2/3 large subunit